MSLFHLNISALNAVETLDENGDVQYLANGQLLDESAVETLRRLQITQSELEFF